MSDLSDYKRYRDAWERRQQKNKQDELAALREKNERLREALREMIYYCDKFYYESGPDYNEPFEDDIDSARALLQESS